MQLTCFFALALASALSALRVQAISAEATWFTGGDTQGACGHLIQDSEFVTNAGFAHVNNPLGSGSYPHAFRNDEGLRLFCSGNAWFEWPILTGGTTYSGGSPGADRVIFNTAGTYCAVVTHTGAPTTNGFVSCLND
ncbi:Guanyl-specific ribonuclease C2 [Mycena kentingensis (nom. inval.)]|nr:Guanyl-specific ribonuclease C2 [Mycena kentingensis (nom. inval.)]